MLTERLKEGISGPKLDIRLNPVALFIYLVLLVLSGGIAFWLASEDVAVGWIIAQVLALNLVGLYVLVAFKIASQWEKAIVLRLGRFTGLKGPGPFWIIPLVDAIPIWVDHRVMVTPFTAERTLTRDTVPVDVDAVLFWVVWDAQKAALEVEDYQAAIAWAAQTALREIIGQMDLADILVGRAKMDEILQHIIDARTTPWGVTVQSVEIRDIVIPKALEDTMSRQAQAERERQARVILGESEQQIAGSFSIASEAYRENPTALHLRAMNMLFLGLKERGSLIIVPSTALDTMNLGAFMGAASLTGSTPQSTTTKDSDET
ncbi:MAG: slipin family protein [Anaerolineae bacterium]|nr:MAG: slipin family protein [Anaerolineae bacterium]